MLGRLLRMGLRNLGRNPRRTAISVAALAGGLALSSVTWVFAEGFLQDSIDNLVSSRTGHVRIEPRGQVAEPNLYDTLPDADALVAELRALPHVEAVTARLDAAGLVSVGELTTGALLRGADPEGELRFGGGQISAGRWLQGPDEVVLGQDVARRLRAVVGEPIVVLTQGADGSLANAAWTVVGVSAGSPGGPDQDVAWVDLATARGLLVLDGAHEVMVLLDDTDAAPALTAALGERPGWSGVLADQPGADVADTEAAPTRTLLHPDATHVARSWRALNPFLAEYQRLSDAWVMLAVGIILLTAAMGATNALLMSVMERTRELGTLAAVGMRPRHVVALVLCEAVVLAVLSTAVGLALGVLGSAWVVNVGVDLRDWYGEFAFAGISVEPHFRGRWLLRAFTLPSVVLAAVTLLASALPAWRAARIDPADAMRRS